MKKQKTDFKKKSLGYQWNNTILFITQVHKDPGEERKIMRQERKTTLEKIMVESFPDFISKPQSTGPRSSGSRKKEKYKEKALGQL